MRSRGRYNCIYRGRKTVFLCVYVVLLNIERVTISVSGKMLWYDLSAGNLTGSIAILLYLNWSYMEWMW